MSSDEFDFEMDEPSDASFNGQSDDESDASFREENDHPNKGGKGKAAAKAKSGGAKKTSSKKTSNANNKGGKKKSAAPAKKTNKKRKHDESDLDLSEDELSNKERKIHGEKTIEETYQKKTQLEHILLRPDTYIGSTEPLTQNMFILSTNNEEPKLISREITYTPGLYKIFDEILVNAADNKQRDGNMDKLEVNIDVKGGTISVKNNGRGIPVVVHKEHGCYVPTLILGHLLTGSNFNDKEKKTTGGRNGYGAKLANIFSTKFIVECRDTKEGLNFKQVFRNNMADTEDPVIKKCSDADLKKGDYVKITFKPDLKRFNMTHLDEDTVGLMSKRAYDIAGCMAQCGGKRLNVYLNGSKIPVKDFKSYLALFEGIDAPAAYEKVGDQWEVGIGMSDGTFQQISFVNAIATTKGGGHVNYISDIVAKSLQAAVKKKNKGGKEIKPAQIKNHMSVFVNCLVENPTFDSQTKENLTTRPTDFKKKVQLSEKFLKQVEKCGIVDDIVRLSQFKEKKSLERKNGTKKSKLTGISKLDDANFAGTGKSKDCTLIITEGDSAKSLAVSGLSVVGRDTYGVFPLKGKPLNVRDATTAQIKKNEEIMNLVEIMGLKFGTTYTEENIKSLRYGHLMIMADQDHDGSHIKGLIINFIQHFWPSLLDVPDFLQQFITPIVKCTKGKKTHTFFTLPEYEMWKEGTGNDAKGWTIKYYKGLGTSTSSEAKEYFSNLDTHVISFNEISSDIIDIDDEDMDEDVMTGDVITSGAGLIDMAFSKSKVEARKKWLSTIEKDTYLNYREAQDNGVNYSEFINRELILFSNADNARSIPHIMDGFKPSQRKVLFACFKKKLKTEIKVAQLAGYIGEHSAYHHGDQSLQGAIIGMAQSYCGSNNVNLLYPSGQFGTRRMGGKDHASARYIFTRLEKIARAIFHPDDDDLLNYLNDDGLSVEPEYYMPVIPMVLVNGSEGIGTGYSTTIQNHDPREVITNIRKMINGEEPDEMHPYFAGFTGEIIADTGKKDGSYTVNGKIERIDDTTLLISELPVGKWTQDYKTFLEGMVSGSEKSPGEISDFKENHTDTTVSFTVTATEDKIDEFEKAKGGLQGKFKLSTSISTKNMTAFDVDGKLHRYASTTDILRVFFDQRLEYYVKRKDLLLEKMRRELKILDNKARFVEEVCKGDLVVSSRKRTELLAELQEREYDLFPKENQKMDGDEVEEEFDESATDADLAKGYEYLLGMKIWSLTFERAQELRRQLAEKTEEVSTLEATEPQTIWLNDLTAIEEALDERDVELDAEAKKEKSAQSKARTHVAKKATAAAAKKKKAKKKKDEWDSDLEDSDDEGNEFVAVKPKPVPKKKTPPKKQLISIGTSEQVPKKGPGKKATKESIDVAPKKSTKTDEKKAPAKKKSLPSPEDIVELSDGSDEEMDDFFDDNESVGSYNNKSKASAPAANSVRNRRSRTNVSYKVDDSSESDPEEESDDDEVQLVEQKEPEMKPKPKKSDAKKDEWDLDFDDDMSFTKKKSAPKSSVTSNQKAASKPDPSRALQSLSVDNDDIVDSQSFGYPSPAKKKPTKDTKKVVPKKKSPTVAKAKSATKKTEPAKKSTKMPDKSICDLTSDDDDLSNFLVDDESVPSKANSIESDGTGDMVMKEASKATSRRARGKPSYQEAESSEEEFDNDDDSDVEFD